VSLPSPSAWNTMSLSFEPLIFAWLTLLLKFYDFRLKYYFLPFKIKSLLTPATGCFLPNTYRSLQLNFHLCAATFPASLTKL
jgi:hypothetical protein